MFISFSYLRIEEWVEYTYKPGDKGCLDSEDPNVSKLFSIINSFTG